LSEEYVTGEVVQSTGIVQYCSGSEVTFKHTCDSLCLISDQFLVIKVVYHVCYVTATIVPSCTLLTTAFSIKTVCTKVAHYHLCSFCLHTFACSMFSCL